MRAAPQRLTILCPNCDRRIGTIAEHEVTSMLPAVFVLTGKGPPARYSMEHATLPPSRRTGKRCRYRKVESDDWMAKAWQVARRTGRTRLYPDEVDRG